MCISLRIAWVKQTYGSSLPTFMAQGRPTCQEEKKDMLITTLSAYLSNTVLSTAWMPLDGLIQEWGTFGAEHASTAPALHAVGMAFCALARETTARTYYTAAWHASQDDDLTDLEHALEELLHARQYWTDAMLSLELLLLDSNEEPTSQGSLHLAGRGDEAAGAGGPARPPDPTGATGCLPWRWTRPAERG